MIGQEVLINKPLNITIKENVGNTVRSKTNRELWDVLIDELSIGLYDSLQESVKTDLNE